MTICALPCSAQKVKAKTKTRDKSDLAVSIIDQQKGFTVQQGIRHELETAAMPSASEIVANALAGLDSLANIAATYGIQRDSLLAMGRTLAQDTESKTEPIADSAGEDSPDSEPDAVSANTEIERIAIEAHKLEKIHAEATERLLAERNDIAALPDSLAVSPAGLMEGEVKRDSLDMAQTAETPGLADVAENAGNTQSDSTGYRKSLVVKHGIARDSIPISKLTLISAIVPGFSQIYEGNYWKAAAGYVAIGVPLALSFKQNKEYRDYKKQYDALVLGGASRAELDPVQAEMIKHNTYRQLLWAGAALSYMALLADGVANYPSELTGVKKATTLSMIMPGAGQFYNRSYWRIPFVVGAFATMGYIVDWNNRGYQRFKLAYQLVADDDATTVDEFNGRYSANFLKNIKNQYRRNRDLAIIGMAGVYLLNVIDAHVDAHLKDFDVSDDLTLNISPEFSTHASISNGLTSTVGLNLNFTF